MTLTDSDLVRRALGGDQAACRDIVLTHQRAVYNLIVRMVRNHAVAEDLAQETFLRAFSRLGTYKPEFKLSNWLLKIAHNIVIDWLRQRRPAAVSLDTHDQAAPQAAFELADARAEDPLRHLEQEELSRILERALARLRPEYRQVVVLRYHEDLALEEIAEVTGMPLGTVKSCLHRARAELGAHLREMLPSSVLADVLPRPATSGGSEP